MIGAVEVPVAAPFLRVRLASLFLLSLAAVDAAFLAWMPSLMDTVLMRVLPPVGLGAAALAGAALQDRLSLLAERVGRSRFRAGAGTLHVCVVAYALLGVGAGQREAVESAVRTLAALQPLFLLLTGAGRGSIGAVLNAAALTGLAAVAGGWGAAAGVTLHVPLLIVFLTADHLSRKLAEYPVEEAPGAGLLAREAAGPAIGTAALLAGFFWAVPPRPYAALPPGPTSGTLEGARVAELALQILGIAGLAAVAFYLLLRWGGGMRSDLGEPDVRRPGARRRDEKAPPPAWAPLPAPEGLRGRIVGLYLRTLEQLARRGLRRRRGETPREFEPRLAPPEAAAELTRLFMQARYGAEEPREGDAERAEEAGRRILGA